jgi:tetratricopeptide (TPR) repeat protein
LPSHSIITELLRDLQSSCVFSYNMNVMYRWVLLWVVLCAFTGLAFAQESAPPPVEQLPTDKSAPAPKDNAKAPPRSDGGESSSADTRIDVSPPKDDSKVHPESGLGESDVNEFTPYNPMKAMKCVEVGDYYFKKENYRGAISRYREALEYKPHDAEATFKLAEVLNKTGDVSGATENYEEYLKMMPNGPYAKRAKEALQKIKAANGKVVRADN